MPPPYWVVWFAALLLGVALGIGFMLIRFAGRDLEKSVSRDILRSHIDTNYHAYVEAVGGNRDALNRLGAYAGKLNVTGVGGTVPLPWPTDFARQHAAYLYELAVREGADAWRASAFPVPQ